ncbi:hypothetical protein GLAREA_10668 [Glarea lozoyensis ATCC 20868]|uniref:Uncharacterized protein n=1 Tax=Glarea lozoyensis (strain ATCC 20868 / MF5171) TaxID=1116229 RepID=S3E9I9_GLAL2|nr:uncharacterized protein GLAREA_10668 [Glarea lozoyensis ATCC 20868]EPE34973.1 hypothetical protein GLAREA_10668 [Glarea lozoyensis ATCC 20868]
MLGSPSFQNFCIEQLRYDCWEEVAIRNTLWPTPDQARDIYWITSPKSTKYEDMKYEGERKHNQLRRFVASVIAVIHPLGRFQEDDKLYHDWMKVVEEVLDIGDDIFRASNESWIDVKPWHRGLFNVEDTPIRQRWKDMVEGNKR